MDCDSCINYEYDEEDDEYYCTSDMDEDDYARLMQERPGTVGCPCWQAADEYAVVAHQAFARGPILRESGAEGTSSGVRKSLQASGQTDKDGGKTQKSLRYHKAVPGPEYGQRIN